MKFFASQNHNKTYRRIGGNLFCAGAGQSGRFDLALDRTAEFLIETTPRSLSFVGLWSMDINNNASPVPSVPPSGPGSAPPPPPSYQETMGLVNQNAAAVVVARISPVQSPTVPHPPQGRKSSALSKVLKRCMLLFEY